MEQNIIKSCKRIPSWDNLALRFQVKGQYVYMGPSCVMFEPIGAEGDGSLIRGAQDSTPEGPLSTSKLGNVCILSAILDDSVKMEENN